MKCILCDHACICVPQISVKQLHLHIFGKLLVLLDFYALQIFLGFYPTALKGCRGIVFTHGVPMGGRAGGGKKFVRAVSQKP